MDTDGRIAVDCCSRRRTLIPLIRMSTGRNGTQSNPVPKRSAQLKRSGGNGAGKLKRMNGCSMRIVDLQQDPARAFIRRAEGQT